MSPQLEGSAELEDQLLSSSIMASKDVDVVSNQHQSVPAAARQLHLHMHIDGSAAAGSMPVLNPAMLQALLSGAPAAAAELLTQHSQPIMRGKTAERSSAQDATSLAATAAAVDGSACNSAAFGLPKRRRRRWVRLLLRIGAVALSMAAGAGAAVFLLRPKLQELESSCGQLLREQRALAERHTALAEAKTALVAEVEALMDSQGKLQQHSAQLEAQFGSLQAESQALVAANGQLEQQLQELKTVRAQLLAEQRQRQEEQQAQQERQQKEQQHLQQPLAMPSYPPLSAPGTGDLNVSVHMPNFSDALIRSIRDADLVPTLAATLVKEVDSAKLLPGFADALVAGAGDRVSRALCPWKWTDWRPWKKNGVTSSDSTSEGTAS